MLTREISETDLWNLDVIGIKDQAEKQSKMEQEEAARQHFLKTLKRLPEGRYEVSLPWLEGLQPPANNRIIAEGRLKRTIKTLQSQNLLRDYEDVFHEWLKEEIIEPVNISRLDDLLCTYLPHRAVIKENSTTKIRPVFDASAKQKNGSSLNSCLEKGPNLVELIPSILNRFRLGTFGVIADIKKAFFQISIDDKDRDYLRFLWFENGDPDKLKTYRQLFDNLTNVSSFVKIVRITTWMRRFIRNCRNSKILCSAKYLEVEEMKEAETIIWKMIQKTSVGTVNEERLRNLRPFIDPSGVFRIKTQLLMRKDFENFRYPILLPSDHMVVQKMIMHKHKTLSHCGVQTLMSILREEFWILKSRRTMRKAIKTSTVCRRFEAKHSEVQAAPLPEGRLRDSATFEISGIDLAGPLYLRDGSKAWVVLYTCAVYRAVHLELVTSLTTDKFLLSLRRFIARRGRPSIRIIYTDNGSNFKGSNQALNKVDWNKINDDTSVSRIQWKFIPPSSPWWGGFWERLIGILKATLRKVFGKASLRYEELSTILCDCENIINSRPITYIYEDLELGPLTPAMFLRDIQESGIPDLDQIDSTSLQKRFLYRLKLREDLRKRFRSEYLGQLRSYAKRSRNRYTFCIGDVVLVESTVKRINWPLGKVVQLIEGKDGVVRLVKIRTKQGDLLRTIQGLYPLEVSSSNDGDLRKLIEDPTICEKK
ncbi:hypothetical protein AVEN_163084-1 [Araneus ventricosus]|uniref:Integrase catalytic domain-containing protein n=1 Tax=Araneus ventricosus TaxID=182803 RepID=A0A4Y2I3Y1_ARAVE|nr:hypothetical protein AVEN_163084-1 [Araneus ventricosus]